MSNSLRVRKLVQTLHHIDGDGVSHHINHRKYKIYKRSATLLTVLLCVATLAALDASSSQPQEATLQLNPIDSNQSPVSPDNKTTAGDSSPSVENSSTTNASVSSDSSNSTTKVTVNGKSISVPADGSYQQTIDNGSGDTSIQVNHSSSASSGHNSSSVDINVDTLSGGDN